MVSARVHADRHDAAARRTRCPPPPTTARTPSSSAQTAFTVDSTDCDVQRARRSPPRSSPTRPLGAAGARPPSATSPTRRKIIGRRRQAGRRRPVLRRWASTRRARRREADAVPPRRRAAGRPAPGEVVIDAAHGGEAALRGRRPRPHRHARRGAATFRVVGIARFGNVKSLGTATAAVFDLETAQKLFHKQGRYDSILVAGKDGASGADVRKALAAELGASAKVQTAAAARPLHARRPEAVHRDHQDRPARVRRRGDPRGRVHDLQHALDHRRPAHARVRDCCGWSAPRAARCSAR